MRITKEQDMMAAIGFEVEEFKSDKLPHGDGNTLGWRD